MGRAAILAGFDASEFAGVTLFTRNGVNVNAPALASMHDGGHYPDALAFLNGYASQLTLTQQASTAWSGIGGSGTMTAGIDSDGFVYLRCSANEEFTVTGDQDPDGDWPFGFTASTVSVSDSGGHRATATTRFKRGNIDLRSALGQFGITRTLGGGPVGVPRRGVYHSVPTLLSGPTTPDLDEVVQSLEKWDNDTADNSNRRLHWGIDSEGRTWTSWESTLSADLVWSSTAFKRALGFVGNETAVLAAGRYLLTSTYPARGVLILRQGLAQLANARAWQGAGGNTLGGRVYGRVHSVTTDITVEAILKGGVGLTEAASPYADEEQVYLKRVAPYLGVGARVTVLPEWGDPRRGASLVSQFQDGVTTPVAYSAAVRSDAGGVMGRKRCEVSTDTATEHLAAFRPGVRTFTEPLQWRLRVIPDV